MGLSHKGVERWSVRARAKEQGSRLCRDTLPPVRQLAVGTRRRLHAAACRGRRSLLVATPPRGGVRSHKVGRMALAAQVCGCGQNILVEFHVNILLVTAVLAEAERVLAGDLVRLQDGLVAEALARVHRQT